MLNDPQVLAPAKPCRLPAFATGCAAEFEQLSYTIASGKSGAKARCLKD
jgi:hypothetical protein